MNGERLTDELKNRMIDKKVACGKGEELDGKMRERGIDGWIDVDQLRENNG